MTKAQFNANRHELSALLRTASKLGIDYVCLVHKFGDWSASFVRENEPALAFARTNGEGSTWIEIPFEDFEAIVACSGLSYALKWTGDRDVVVYTCLDRKDDDDRLAFNHASVVRVTPILQ